MHVARVAPGWLQRPARARAVAAGLERVVDVPEVDHLDAERRALPRRAWPGAALSFHAVGGCHWRSFLGDLHHNLAGTAVMFSQND